MLPWAAGGRAALAACRLALAYRRQLSCSRAGFTRQTQRPLDTAARDTLLTWAARRGRAEAVRLLLEGGASIGVVDADAASTLLLAE